jgi:hypothetical protein
MASIVLPERQGAAREDRSQTAEDKPGESDERERRGLGHGDRGRRGAEIALPDEEVAAVDVAIGVGVTERVVELAGRAEVAAESHEVEAIHDAVAGEVGGVAVPRSNDGEERGDVAGRNLPGEPAGQRRQVERGERAAGSRGG